MFFFTASCFGVNEVNRKLFLISKTFFQILVQVRFLSTAADLETFIYNDLPAMLPTAAQKNKQVKIEIIVNFVM